MAPTLSETPRETATLARSDVAAVSMTLRAREVCSPRDAVSWDVPLAAMLEESDSVPASVWEEARVGTSERLPLSN
jgi:hypothetical protein